MKAKVWACSFDRTTGKQIEHYQTGLEPSSEEIDTKKNMLFEGVDTILDIKKAYEAFWNDMNDTSDLVFVTKIELVDNQK